MRKIVGSFARLGGAELRGTRCESLSKRDLFDRKNGRTDHTNCYLLEVLSRQMKSEKGQKRYKQYLHVMAIIKFVNQ